MKVIVFGVGREKKRDSLGRIKGLATFKSHINVSLSFQLLRMSTLMKIIKFTQHDMNFKTLSLDRTHFISMGKKKKLPSMLLPIALCKRKKMQY